MRSSNTALDSLIDAQRLIWKRRSVFSLEFLACLLIYTFFSCFFLVFFSLVSSPLSARANRIPRASVRENGARLIDEIRWGSSPRTKFFSQAIFSPQPRDLIREENYRYNRYSHPRCITPSPESSFVHGNHFLLSRFMNFQATIIPLGKHPPLVLSSLFFLLQKTSRWESKKWIHKEEI